MKTNLIPIAASGFLLCSAFVQCHAPVPQPALLRPVEPAIKAPPADITLPDDFYVFLEKRAFHWPRLSYSISIHRSGLVQFHGIANPRVREIQSIQIPEQDLLAIARLVEHAQFFRVYEKYRVFATHSDHRSILICGDGRGQQEESSYEGKPNWASQESRTDRAEVEMLSQLFDDIEHIVGAERWIGKP